MKRFLTIRKNALFYDVYDDDAIILNYLLGYKNINGRVGFPINAISKVINILEDKKINYKIIGEQEEVKDFKNLNQYLNILAKAANKIEVNNKINKILDKLKTFDEGSLYEILDKIESIVYENQWI